MLDYLGVTEELLLNDLSENDEKNLRNFTGAVLYNRKIGFPNMEQDQFYGAFKIANLVIWIWAKRQSDGMYSIDSFFKLHQIALFTDDDVDLKKPIQTSQFVLFDKKGWFISLIWTMNWFTQTYPRHHLLLSTARRLTF